MNIFKKKATDLTVGESLKLSVIITVALMPLCLIPLAIEKFDEWKANRK
jgi:hypothetical protein